MAISLATAAGWWLGMLSVPVPSLMRRVAWAKVAMKIALEVMFSSGSVECSPQ